MALTITQDKVLAEVLGAGPGTGRLARQAVLVLIGIAVLTISARISVPMWPVPVTMGTFAVLALGAAYGPGLGLVTILGYMALGVMGFDVFAGSSAEAHGIAYMMGGTGGYLVGYVLATVALGLLARRGWDRSAVWMAAAMVIGNAIIYVPGVLWLGVLYGWDQPILAWGLWPFLIGDGLKLGLAALLIPGLWTLLGRARG